MPKKVQPDARQLGRLVRDDPQGARMITEIVTLKLPDGTTREEVIANYEKTAPTWRENNAYVERVIGSLRRELFDHIVVFNEQHLKRLLSPYLGYYHSWRTHRSLGQDALTVGLYDRPSRVK